MWNASMTSAHIDIQTFNPPIHLLQNFGGYSKISKSQMLKKKKNPNY